MIEDAANLPDEVTSTPISNADQTAVIGMSVPVRNYAGKSLCIEMVTMDGAGNESAPQLNPVRMIYVPGAGGTASPARVVTVTDVDTVLTPGNQIVEVTALTRIPTITLPAETMDVGDTVYVKWMPGSTYDVYVVVDSGDTVDGSTVPTVLNSMNPIWGGVGT